ncbi:MAG: hypothetical protein J5903_03115, partial [Clostridia bacterium]|nr:hypothetical protein [Clostridia bacterium]
LGDGGNISASGIVSVLDSYGFLCDERGYKLGKVFLPKSVIYKYGLRDGDRISGRADKNAATDLFELRSVDLINGRSSADAASEKSFIKATATYSEHRISLASAGDYGRAADVFCPLGNGHRAIIEISEDENVEVEKLARALEEQGIAALILTCGCRPEDFNYLKDVCPCEIACNMFDENEQETLRTVDLALSRAARLAENGRDAAVILPSLTNAYNILGDEKTRQLFAYCKNTEDVRSVTLVALDDGRSGVAERYVKFANCFLKVKDGKLDPYGSFSRQKERLLSKKAADRVKQLYSEHTTDLGEAISAALKKSRTEEEFILALGT